MYMNTFALSLVLLAKFGLFPLFQVQPNFEVVNNVRKLERIPGSNYVLRKYKKNTSPVPGKTYVMNKKNTELCNKMFNK